MKKKNLILISFVFALLLFGNISAPPPCIQGDIAGESVLKDISVRDELLSIDFDRFKDSSYAFVEAKYTLETVEDNAIVPLIFVAKGLANDDYRILLDDGVIAGKTIALDTVPDAWKIPENVLPQRIDYYSHGETKPINKDLIAFDVPLSKGKHRLEVSYKTKLSKDVLSGEPVASYEFFYILRPTNQWKSFHNVTIKVKLQEGWEMRSNLAFDENHTFTCGDIYELKDNYFYVRTQVNTSNATNRGTFLQVVLSILLVVSIIFIQVFLYKKVFRATVFSTLIFSTLALSTCAFIALTYIMGIKSDIVFIIWLIAVGMMMQAFLYKRAPKFIIFSTFIISSFILSIYSLIGLVSIMTLKSDVYNYFLGNNFEQHAYNRASYGLGMAIPFFWVGILIGIVCLNLVIRYFLNRKD